MAIEFNCQVCGQKYRVKDDLAGRKTKCKHCSTILIIPPGQPVETVFSINELLDEEFDSVPKREAFGGHDSPQANSFQAGVETVASLPAQLELDVWHYLRCYPMGYCRLGVIGVACLFIAAVCLVGPRPGLAMYPLLGCAGAAVFIYRHLRRARSGFMHGDACPAVVLSDDPWIVAVYTDLSTQGTTDHPAIKILRQPLSRMTGGPPKVGDRLTAVAVYVGTSNSLQTSLQEPCWADFNPKIANCGSSDTVALRRMLDRIPTRLWQDLAHYLTKGTTDKPGLYPLWQTPKGSRKSFSWAKTGSVIFTALAIVVLKLAPHLDLGKQPAIPPKLIPAQPGNGALPVPHRGHAEPPLPPMPAAAPPVPPAMRPAVERPPRTRRASKAVSGETAVLGGGADRLVRDSAPSGARLVGFEVGLGKFVNSEIVQAIRPIYLRGEEESFGQQIGTEFQRVVSSKARPGYAVGAITVKAGLCADGFSITYMRIKDDRLDPTDAYESEWLGGKGGAGPKRLGGDGRQVLGVLARQNGNKCTGLGLSFAESDARTAH
jgi:hypothetical protein